MKRATLLALVVVALAGCGGDPVPRTPATEGPSRDDPAATTTPAPAPAEREAPAAFAGSASCTSCHEEQAQAFADSAHAAAARTVTGTLDPPLAADFRQPSPRDDVRLQAEPPGQVVADANGDVRPRPVRHVLGSRRREDFLTRIGDGWQVLPLSWSVTAGRWVEGVVDELGIRPGAGSPWSWDGERRSWQRACARCHVLPEPKPERAGEAGGAAEGIGCETCHGPSARHGTLAESELPSLQAVVRAAPDAWSGCAHCHLSGGRLPREAGGELGAGDPFDDHLVAATFVGPSGVDPRFRADGRPGTPHGFAVQSLAQAACHVRGGATCLTCHDPHGGGLRDADPDASCRGCHAEIAAAAAEHAGHPVLAGPVPRSSAEPAGPDPKRLPGCVDCHLPATLAFGRGDRVRDHAIGNPAPELELEAGVPDACTACHEEEGAAAMVEALQRSHPERDRSRVLRARAYRRALALMAGRVEADAAETAESVRELADLLGAESDPWSRAGVARLLGGLGVRARPAAGDLLAVARSDDVTLARAALAALARTGGGSRLELAELARTAPDWRVRLPAAVALDAAGDARGAAEMEVLRADDALPAAARAEATFELGLSLLRRGALQRASFVLEEATVLAPRSVPAWLNLGTARAGADDLDGARLAWLTVLDLEPGHPLARANLARLARETVEP